MIKCTNEKKKLASMMKKGSCAIYTRYRISIRELLGRTSSKINDTTTMQYSDNSHPARCGPSSLFRFYSHYLGCRN